MTVTQAHIRAGLEKLPRFKLSHLNTPLEPLDRLRQALIDEGVSVPNRMLVKRDDTTGLAFGGNKGRHFEFEIANILEGGYDTVININHYHSNQARLIAAGCVKADLKYHIVSLDMVDAPLTGNLLLCKLMGAKVHCTPTEYGRQALKKYLRRYPKKAAGRTYCSTTHSPASWARSASSKPVSNWKISSKRPVSKGRCVSGG